MILHIVHPFDDKIVMQKDEQGCFHADAHVGAGARYFFVPAGKDLPDPASRFQPDGVHGASEVVDESTYKWQDGNWKGIPFGEVIMTEVHVGTFTEDGTFEAMISKLDHLVATGINAIELMPVAQFPGNRNWGYDGVFPYAVQNSYGGPEGLKKLVDACHQKGIAVFLDVVFNHLGPEGNYFEEFGPWVTDRYKSPWGRAINFDGAYSDAVREFFSDNAIYWFDVFHLDGLRFDAIHGLFDMGAVHFWELMHEKIHSFEQEVGRRLYTIAESDFNSPRVVKSIEMGGYGFTAQWLDDFHHALYTILDDGGRKFYADFGSMQQLAKAYKDGFVHSGEYVKFRKRKHGSSSAGVSGDRFVAFTDNHDQAGNRATGARLAPLLGFDKMKLAAAALLLSPYVPMLFMGEEYGEDTPFFYFISHSDEELVKAVREGRKREFEHFDWTVEPPDPQDETVFQRSKLQWAKLGDRKHGKMLNWYKELIRLRRGNSALKNAAKNDLVANVVEDVLTLHRRSRNHKDHVVIIFNFSESKEATTTLPDVGSSWTKILDSNEETWTEEVRGQIYPATVKAGDKLVVGPLSTVAYGSQ